MSSEKRKKYRRSFTYPGQIDLGDGSPPRKCMLRDASDTGAQILVASPDELPNEFFLILSYDGAAQRRCRVMWRTENRVGVKFPKEPGTVSAPPAGKHAAAAK
jgi:hypothetical protein